jgi:hypothetical protein
MSRFLHFYPRLMDFFSPIEKSKGAGLIAIYQMPPHTIHASESYHSNVVRLQLFLYYVQNLSPI